MPGNIAQAIAIRIYVDPAASPGVVDFFPVWGSQVVLAFVLVGCDFSPLRQLLACQAVLPAPALPEAVRPALQLQGLVPLQLPLSAAVGQLILPGLS